MLRIAEVKKGASTAALLKMNDVMKEDKTDISALNFVVWCERAIRELKIFKDNLIKEANYNYTQLAETGQMKIEDFALLTKNSAKGIWLYPADIIKKEVDLKALKQTAQKNKQASKQVTTLNPNENFLFKIQILNI